MKDIEVLNTIYTMTPKQLCKFLEEYDIEEFNDLDILDDGIQDTKLNKIYSLTELANAAEIIAGLEKLPYPRIYKEALSKLDVLSEEQFSELYKLDKNKALIALSAATKVTEILNDYNLLLQKLNKPD